MVSFSGIWLHRWVSDLRCCDRVVAWIVCSDARHLHVQQRNQLYKLWMNSFKSYEPYKLWLSSYFGRRMSHRNGLFAAFLQRSSVKDLWQVRSKWLRMRWFRFKAHETQLSEIRKCTMFFRLMSLSFLRLCLRELKKVFWWKWTSC